jgi:acyl-CoA synthetase (AMP-forming)/AMP-acid ligase II
LVRAVEPTHLALVATHVELLAAADAFDLPSLRSVFYGASLLREPTLRRLAAEHPHLGLIRWYGQTEASPISWLSPGDHARAAGGEEWLFDTVGLPLPGVEVRIDAPSDDGVGEIWARAAHLSAVDREGWRATGDMGVLIDGGYLRLAGRSGDMIIRGGENVYPIEVEKVLAAHPRVADAVVMGVPDDVMGQRIKAFVQFTDPNSPLTESELRDYAREHLAGFKVPVEWEITASFERNASGKVVRARLR